MGTFDRNCLWAGTQKMKCNARVNFWSMGLNSRCSGPSGLVQWQFSVPTWKFQFWVFLGRVNSPPTCKRGKRLVIPGIGVGGMHLMSTWVELFVSPNLHSQSPIVISFMPPPSQQSNWLVATGWHKLQQGQRSYLSQASQAARVKVHFVDVF